MFTRRFVKSEISGPSKGEERTGQRRSSKKGHRRFGVLLSGLQSTFRSPLIFFLILLVLSTLGAVFTEAYYVILIPLAVFVVRFRKLVFEFFVLQHVVENNLDLFPWFSLVDDELYLGAIPILPSHRELFVETLRIGCVLSVVEDFELNSGTFVGYPVTAQEWKRLDVLHKQLPSVDFRPPSFEVLDRGADYLNENLTERRRVYVHCKSGVGRSASVVVAYFMKFKRMSAKEAFLELKRHRPVIFGENSWQMKNMLAYEAYLKRKEGSQ